MRFVLIFVSVCVVPVPHFSYTEIKEVFHGDTRRITAGEKGEKGGLFVLKVEVRFAQFVVTRRKSVGFAISYSTNLFKPFFNSFS